VPAERFRANLEVDLEPAFAEAAWPEGRTVYVGEHAFRAVGRCVRCQAVDVDPESGETKGPSLLAALATARPGGGKGPTFGVLLRLLDEGLQLGSTDCLKCLSVGDDLSAEAPP